MATKHHFKFFIKFLKMSICILSIWTQVIDLRILSKLGEYSPLNSAQPCIRRHLVMQTLFDIYIYKTMQRRSWWQFKCLFGWTSNLHCVAVAKSSITGLRDHRVIEWLTSLKKCFMDSCQGHVLSLQTW